VLFKVSALTGYALAFLPGERLLSNRVRGAVLLEKLTVA
jgi:hypothetical protein